jgi:erythromycin esterase
MKSMSEPPHTETDRSAIVDALQAASISLETVDPAVSLDDLSWLQNQVSAGTVVGLGEASHGTREFFRFKHRVFRYLAEEMGYRLFAIEEDFATMLPVNEYVTEGTGDPRESLLTREVVHPWQVESVLELIEWAREFNEGREPEDKIRLHGFDMQSEAVAKDRLVSYFERVDEDALAEIEDAAQRLDPKLYREGDEEQQDAYVERQGRLATYFDEQLTENRETYIERSSERAFERARGLANQLCQKHRAFRPFHEGEEHAYGPRRDEAMAETVEWLLEFEDEDAIAIWAHNAHIKRGAKTTFEDDDSPAMGEFLQQSEREYVPIGFSVAEGSFRIWDMNEGEIATAEMTPPPTDSVPDMLSELEDDIAALDLQSLPTDGPVEDWLASEPTQHNLHGGYEEDPMNYAESNPRDDFDHLIFVREGTPARDLLD